MITLQLQTHHFPIVRPRKQNRTCVTITVLEKLVVESVDCPVFDVLMSRFVVRPCWTYSNFATSLRILCQCQRKHVPSDWYSSINSSEEQRYECKLWWVWKQRWLRIQMPSRAILHGTSFCFLLKRNARPENLKSEVIILFRGWLISSNDSG